MPGRKAYHSFDDSDDDTLNCVLANAEATGDDGSNSDDEFDVDFGLGGGGSQAGRLRAGSGRPSTARAAPSAEAAQAIAAAAGDRPETARGGRPSQPSAIAALRRNKAAFGDSSDDEDPSALLQQGRPPANDFDDSDDEFDVCADLPGTSPAQQRQQPPSSQHPSQQQQTGPPGPPGGSPGRGRRPRTKTPSPQRAPPKLRAAAEQQLEEEAELRRQEEDSDVEWERAPHLEQLSAAMLRCYHPPPSGNGLDVPAQGEHILVYRLPTGAHGKMIVRAESGRARVSWWTASPSVFELLQATGTALLLPDDWLNLAYGTDRRPSLGDKLDGSVRFAVAEGRLKVVPHADDVCMCVLWRIPELLLKCVGRDREDAGEEAVDCSRSLLAELPRRLSEVTSFSEARLEAIASSFAPHDPAVHEVLLTPEQAAAYLFGSSAAPRGGVLRAGLSGAGQLVAAALDSTAVHAAVVELLANDAGRVPLSAVCLFLDQVLHGSDDVRIDLAAALPFIIIGGADWISTGEAEPADSLAELLSSELGEAGDIRALLPSIGQSSTASYSQLRLDLRAHASTLRALADSCAASNQWN